LAGTSHCHYPAITRDDAVRARCGLKTLFRPQAQQPGDEMRREDPRIHRMPDDDDRRDENVERSKDGSSLFDLLAKG
jgi:hypothetical protein